MLNQTIPQMVSICLPEILLQKGQYWQCKENVKVCVIANTKKWYTYIEKRFENYNSYSVDISLNDVLQVLARRGKKREIY